MSVCFEGEISAIHTAIERGVAVAGAEHTVKSLVIARPERCVVEALSNLKGNPPPAKSGRTGGYPRPGTHRPLPPRTKRKINIRR